MGYQVPAACDDAQSQQSCRCGRGPLCAGAKGEGMNKPQALECFPILVLVVLTQVLRRVKSHRAIGVRFALYRIPLASMKSFSKMMLAQLHVVTGVRTRFLFAAECYSVRSGILSSLHLLLGIVVASSLGLL